MSASLSDGRPGLRRASSGRVVAGIQANRSQPPLGRGLRAARCSEGVIQGVVASRFHCLDRSNDPTRAAAKPQVRSHPAPPAPPTADALKARGGPQRPDSNPSRSLRETCRQSDERGSTLASEPEVDLSMAPRSPRTWCLITAAGRPGSSAGRASGPRCRPARRAPGRPPATRRSRTVPTQPARLRQLGS